MADIAAFRNHQPAIIPLIIEPEKETVEHPQTATPTPPHHAAPPAPPHTSGPLRSATRSTRAPTPSSPCTPPSTAMTYLRPPSGSRGPSPPLQQTQAQSYAPSRSAPNSKTSGHQTTSANPATTTPGRAASTRPNP